MSSSSWRSLLPSLRPALKARPPEHDPKRPLAGGIVELLEPRIVYSANAGVPANTGSLTSAQVQTLVTGLESLGIVLHDVDGSASFSSLHGIASGTGTLFPLGSANGHDGFLGDAFRDQFAAQFTGPATVAGVNSFLNAGPAAGSTGAFTGVTWTAVTGGFYGGARPYEWQVTVSGHDSNTVAAKLEGAPSFGTAPTATAGADGAVTFSFGLASDGTFFSTLTDTHVRVQTQQSAPAGTIDFGGGKVYTITSGSLALDSTLTAKLVNAQSADGVLTGAELSTLHTAGTPGIQAAPTGPGLQASYVMSTATPITLLQKSAAPSGTVATIGYDMALSAGLKTAAGATLTGLQTAGATLANNATYTTSLPGLSATVESLTGLDDVFKVGSAATGATTVQQLGAALVAAQPAGMHATFTTTFDPVAGVLHTALQLASGTVHQQVNFDRFGDAASTFGLAFDHDRTYNFDVATTVQGSFDFALDYTANTVSVKPALAVTAGFDDTDINLPATLGPLNASLNHGNAHLHTTLALGGSGSGTLTATDLAGTAPLTFSGTGTFAADLPLETGFAGTNITGGKLSLASANVFTTPVNFARNTPQFDKLFALGRITASDVFDFITDAGTWAGQLSSSSVFNAAIPFTDSTIGDVSDFGSLFTTNLADKLQHAVTFFVPQASFSSFTLAAPLSFQLGAAAGSVTVQLPAGTYSSLAGYQSALNTALNGTGYQAVDDGTGKVRLTHDGDAAFTLAGASADLYRLGFLASLPESSALGTAVTAPVLAADAHLLVSVNGASPVAVTIAAASTAGNTTLADLAGEVQTALSAYGLTVSVGDGGTLKFTQTSGQAFIIGAGTGSDALGLSNALAGGVTGQASVTQTDRSFQTLNDLMPALATALGLPQASLHASLDLSTMTFSFAVDLDYTGPTQQVPADLGLTAGLLGHLQTLDGTGHVIAPTLSITPHLTGHTVFGFSLAGAAAFNEISVTAPKGYAPAGYNLDALGGPDPDSAKAWNGQLAADATFTFSLDDGVAIPLTVAKSATLHNTSVADLAAEVNTAISGTAALAGKIGARVVTGSGGTADRIEFYTKLQSGNFQIRTLEVAAGGSAIADDGLGFLPDKVVSSAAPMVAAVSLPGTVDFSPDADVSFKITVDGGAERTITVTKAAMAGNTTMADLLGELNTALAGDATLAGKVHAVRIGPGTQIALLGGADVQTLRVDADGGAVSGLLFDDAAATTRTNGSQNTLSGTVLQADATMSLSGLQLGGTLGFLGIHTAGSTGAVTFSAHAEVKSGTNTTFSIAELFARAGADTTGAIVQKTLTGSAQATLTGLTVDGGLLPLPGTAALSVHSADIFAAGGAQFTTDLQGMPAATVTQVQNFAGLQWSQIVDGLKAGMAFLSQSEQFTFLKDARIPMLDVAPADYLTYGDAFATLLAKLDATPASTLQGVEAQIEQTLALPATAFTLSLGSGSVLNLHLSLEQTFQDDVGLKFNLTDIHALSNDAIPADLLATGGFVDAAADGTIHLSGFARADLDLAIDISGATPKDIVSHTSGVTIGLRAVGQNINRSVSVGVGALAIHDGLVLLDSDGVLDANGDDLPDDDYATIHFATNADTDAKAANTQIAQGQAVTGFFTTAMAGKLTATLPVSVLAVVGEVEQSAPIQLTVADFGALINRTPGSVHLTLPDFTGLSLTASDATSLLHNSAVLLDGLDSGLALIQRALDSTTSFKLPLIGDQLEAGSHFIEDFRSDFLDKMTAVLRGSDQNLTGSIQQALFDLLSTKLGLLQDYNNDKEVTKDDVVVSFRQPDGTLWKYGQDLSKQDAIQFNMHLGQSITLGTDLKVDFGVPGLSLAIDGHPQVTAGWDLYFGFGVTAKEFYLDTKAPESFKYDSDHNPVPKGVAEHTLSLSFKAVLTTDQAHPFHATGKLFFLQLDATDLKKSNPLDRTQPDDFSHLEGEFFVDLNDPTEGQAKDNRLTLQEMSDTHGKVKPFEFGRDASAVINLSLAASAGGSTVIPRVLTDFYLNWNLTETSAIKATAPLIGFTNTRLDIGSFVTDFLKPILSKIDDAIKPFDPILDALQTKIPVISTFMGRDYTILDLASDFGQLDTRFIKAVLQVRNEIKDIDSLPASGSIEIPIGSLEGIGSQLYNKDGAAAIDTKSAVALVGTIFDSDGDATHDRYKQVLKTSTSLTGGGFGFPIFDASNVFKLLLGQDATLVTYSLPKLEATLSLSKSFPIEPPLFGRFIGSVTASAKLAFGFDTHGLNTYRVSGDPLDILDGFYVSDRANADGTGKDVYEATLKGHIGIAGSLNGAVVEAGIEGYFELTANLDLADPNNDGKVRGSEIAALVKYPNGYGPLNLGSIDLKGEVGAKAYLDVYLLKWKTVWEQDFGKITVFTKHLAAPTVTPSVAGSPVMVNGQNVLTLNAGPNAAKRAFISTNDVGEQYTVTGTGRDVTVTFVNTGDSQTYTGIDKIVMYGGEGDDKLTIGAGVTSSVLFDGGNGDDEFTGGAGDTTVTGGAGNDILRGGTGKNSLDGGDGADKIYGGAGDDIIIGGAGDDTLVGGGGHDTYQFSDGWGRDSLTAGGTGTGKFDFTQVTKNLTLNVSANGATGFSGRDNVGYLGTTPYVDTILGGSGNDIANIASSGAGEVTIDGGGGNDQYLVTFGRLNAAVHLLDSGTGGNDLVQVAPLSGGFNLQAGQHAVTGTKTGLAATQNVTFGDGFENLTIDAKASGGSDLHLTTDLDFTGQVRLSAKTGEIEHTVNASDIRVEVLQGLSVGANLNASVNGDITIVAGGNLTLNGNLYSSTGHAFTGDGSGLIHLLTTSGAISTGVNDDGSVPHVVAQHGGLLLSGAGAVGTVALPIFTQVATLAGVSKGMLNISEADGLVVGTLANIAGIDTGGGTLNLFNAGGELRTEAPIEAHHGDIVLTSDSLQLNADLHSPGGNTVLQPVGVTTVMGIGAGTTGVFSITQDEVNHLVDGFAQITIGRADGRNQINLGALSFTDPAVLRNPILGGHITQTGDVTGTGNATFTILGSGHTIELDSQTVTGTINIVDSAVVRDGETVTLNSTGGNVFLNFNLDGTAGVGTETLNIASLGETVIKGNIGDVVKLDVLHITQASQVRLEGAVRVGTLIVDAGASLLIDGTLQADSISASGIGSATFGSNVTVTGGFSVTASDALHTQGTLKADTVLVTATNLSDFAQSVTANSVTVTSKSEIFRQTLAATTSTLTATGPLTLMGPVTGTTLTAHTTGALSLQAPLTLTGDVDFQGSQLGTGAISAQDLHATVTGSATFGALSLRDFVLGSGTAYFQGDVSGRDFGLTAGSALFANGGAVNVRDLNVTTNAATNGDTRFTGNLTAAAATLNATGSVRFEGTAAADSFSISAGKQIFAGSTFRVNDAGSILLVSNGIDFSGGTNSVQGHGTLTIRPLTAAATVDIGSPTNTGTLSISDTDLNALQDGFSGITIGRVDSTGKMILGSLLVKDDLQLNAGDLQIEANTLPSQDVRVLGDLHIVSHGTVTTADDIFAQNVSILAQNDLTLGATLNGTSATLTAGTDGSGALTVSGAIAVTGPATLTAGSVSGNAAVSADISASTLSIAAPGGHITQTAGHLIAGAVTAEAYDGITIATRTSHLIAEVNGTGNLTVTDDTALPHVLDLGGTSTSDRLYTAQGDISVTAVGDLQAHRVIANGKVNLSGHAVTSEDLSGSQAVFTGTTTLDQDQTTSGTSLVFNGDVKLLRDVTFSTAGGDVTITGRVLSDNGQYGAKFLAGGGHISVGGGDVSFLDVEGAASFALKGALHSQGDFTVDSDQIAIQAPVHSVLTTHGALVLHPTVAGVAEPIQIGRDGAGFVLNDAELLALGDGWSQISIGRPDGTHPVFIEGALFQDSVALYGDSFTLVTPVTAQAVSGISVVNGAEKNSLFFHGHSSFTQGRRTTIAAGGDVAVVADAMALDEVGSNSIRGFGTLSLHAFTSGVAVNLGGTTAAAGLALSARELAAIDSSFAHLQIGDAAAGDLHVFSSLVFKNETLLQTGGNLTVAPADGKPLALQVLRGQGIALSANGDVSLDGSIRTIGRGAISVTADADHSGSGNLTWGSHATKLQPSQIAQTANGSVTLSGVSVDLGVAALPTGVRTPVWGFTSATGSLSMAATDFSLKNATVASLGDLSVHATQSALATDRLSLGRLLLEATTSNSLAATLVQARGAVELDSTAAGGTVGLDGRTSVSSIASILVQASAFQRNGARLTAPVLHLPL